MQQLTKVQCSMVLIRCRQTNSKIQLIFTMAAPSSKEEQEERLDTTNLPKRLDDAEDDVIAAIQAGNDLEDSQSDDELPDPYENMTEEEAWEKYLSTAYERGSKKPMKAPLTAPLGVPISNADVAKLKIGFKSHSMDDKWDLLIEDPDENGGFSVHILRSWLQDECYVLHVVATKPSPPSPPNNDKDDAHDTGDRGVHGTEIQSITWEGDQAGLQCSAEQAQKEAVMLVRGWLHCELETLPHYPSSMFWDPSGYKKLNEGETIH